MLSGLATWFVRKARRMGRLLGRELVVVQSEHDLKLKMEKPHNDARAWDDSLFKNGQLFVDGYANPVKVTVNHNPGIDEKDTVEPKEGTAPNSEDGDGVESEDEEDEDDWIEVIASPRYQQFMEQNLISQLLSPDEQWNKLFYGVLGVMALQFFTVIVTLWSTGSF